MARSGHDDPVDRALQGDGVQLAVVVLSEDHQPGTQASSPREPLQIVSTGKILSVGNG
jgi:hypothetical protein